MNIQINQIAKLKRENIINPEELKNSIPKDINTEINIEYIFNICLNQKNIKKSMII